MDLSIFQFIGPQAFFFLAFFLAFSVLEIFLILILNKIEFSAWEFMIDVVIRRSIQHKKLFKSFAIGSILFAVGIMFYITPIYSILTNAGQEVKIFAGLLVVAMFLIYFTTTHRLAKLAIERKIDKYLYTLISVIFFTVIMVIMNESYGEYKKFVNETFVNPTVQKVQVALEDSKKQDLLTQFRAMAREGKCTDKDYSKEQGGGVLNFVYVQTDVEFITSDASIDTNDPTSYVRGKECTNGTEKFLLTPYGSWYWVVN